MRHFPHFGSQLVLTITTLWLVACNPNAESDSTGQAPAPATPATGSSTNAVSPSNTKTNQAASTNSTTTSAPSTGAELPPAGDLGPQRPGMRPQDEALTENDAIVVNRILVGLRQLETNIVESIRVQVKDGKVALAGSVSTAELRDKIQQIAASSEGARNIQNDIQVEP